ncbi:MAG: AsmA family protein, partial [Pseudomonadota bacterium]
SCSVNHYCSIISILLASWISNFLCAGIVMKKIIISIGVIFFVAIGGLFIFLSTIDVNQYKDDIVNMVEEKTGRRFEINGDLQLAVSFTPAVFVENVTFGNAEWGNQHDMLSVGKFEAQVALLPLLSKQVKIQRLILNDTTILLEKNKNGDANWLLSLAEKSSDSKIETEATSSGELPGLAVDEVRINRATITHKDDSTGKTQTFTINSLGVSASSLTEPMGLELDASYNEIPLSIDGELGTLVSLMNNEAFPVNLKFDLGDLSFSTTGQVAKPKQAKGIDITVTVELNNLNDLNDLAQQELPDAGPIKFIGTIEDIENGYRISKMNVVLGENSINGDMQIAMNSPRPALKLDLNSSLLDLTPFIADSSKEKQESTNEKMFSSDPLPLETLKSADANIVLKVDKVKLPEYELDKFIFDMNLTAGNLSIKQLDAGLLDGEMTTSLDLKQSGQLQLDVKLTSIQPANLPKLKDKISGATTDILIKGNGTGKSMAAIMAGLNGQLLVTAGKGKISDAAMKAASADVLMKTLSLLKPGEKNDGSVLECAVVNFKIKDGMATADKGIAVLTQQLNVMGSGTVNLKTEEMDIGVTPKAREGIGISLGQLAELVRLGGTLANPKVKTDTKAALKTSLSAGAAVATGGLSILAQGLLDKSGSDQNPCDIALGKVTAKSSSTATKQAESKSAVESTTDKVKESAGALGDKLKKLF